MVRARTFTSIKRDRYADHAFLRVNIADNVAYTPLLTNGKRVTKRDYKFNNAAAMYSNNYGNGNIQGSIITYNGFHVRRELRMHDVLFTNGFVINS